MSIPSSPDHPRHQPVPVDLSGIDTAHPEGESTTHLLGTAVAETVAGVAAVYRLVGVESRTIDGGGASIDLELVVEYPHRLGATIDQTREQVAHAATQIVGGVVDVNITVTDIHGPFDAAEEAPQAAEEAPQAAEEAPHAAESAS